MSTRSLSFAVRSCACLVLALAAADQDESTASQIPATNGVAAAPAGHRRDLRESIQDGLFADRTTSASDALTVGARTTARRKGRKKRKKEKTKTRAGDALVAIMGPEQEETTERGSTLRARVTESTGIRTVTFVVTNTVTAQSASYPATENGRLSDVFEVELSSDLEAGDYEWSVQVVNADNLKTLSAVVPFAIINPRKSSFVL